MTATTAAPAARCEVCLPGRVCGVRFPVNGPQEPCRTCGEPARARTLCGEAQHRTCAGGGTAASIREPEPDQPAPSRWLGARVQAERTAARADAAQPVLRAELAERVPTLGAAGVDQAVKLWNGLLRGITYQGAHRTALGILNGTLRHPAIPVLPEAHPDELGMPWDCSVWGARVWLAADPGWFRQAAADGRSDLAGYDINGQYLGAAAIELGVGLPVRTVNPPDSIVRQPGWVRVDDMEGARHGIQERWSPGMALRTELAAYLIDSGATLLMGEAVTQPHHRRWLDPHVDLLRSAREALIVDGSAPALALLGIVKELYTRMFGGLLESTEHNPTATLRPWWAAAIRATGQARMFRALDQVERLNPAGSVALAGVYVDAAWFILPRHFEHPAGLTIEPPKPGQSAGRLGKFKLAGSCPWTADLATAYSAGQQRTLWQALRDSTRGGA